MRNTTRLKQLENAAMRKGARRIFITSDDWQRLTPAMYLDCTGGIGKLSAYVTNNPASLPDEVAARLVNAGAVQHAQDAGDDCIIVRYTAWPPNAQEAI
jgi:hypothetical protein